MTAANPDTGQIVAVSLYCTCGAYRRGKLQLRLARAVLIDWEAQHSGAGHARCEPAVAARARRKAEDDHDKQARKDNAP